MKRQLQRNVLCAMPGSVQGLWMEWGWEVKEGSLELSLEWERWDFERCLRQKEQQAQRLRGIKASAVFNCGLHVIWPGWSPGCGEAMRTHLQCWLGVPDCEGLCSEAKFILR